MVNQTRKSSSYKASDIEILEGLEPVRRRPGMYVGGTDENAMHHLVSEVIDNSMDEVVAGYASFIKVEVLDNNKIIISDDGRGIPIDNHPKFRNKSALEVILTTLHSGGKFSTKVYQTAGGLHGVGLSVVNALSDELSVEVYQKGIKYFQHYSKGKAISKLLQEKCSNKLKGTKIIFKPDSKIFDNSEFNANKIYELANAKAYLYKDVQIYWQCPEELIKNNQIPQNKIIHYPNGLTDYLYVKVNPNNVIGAVFDGSFKAQEEEIKVEWALCYHEENNFCLSYCNTIPTPQGGVHENAARSGLLKSIKNYGELVGIKKTNIITLEDLSNMICFIISVFIKEPVFQGQTKEKLVNKNVGKLIEKIIKDHFDHWLIQDKQRAEMIIKHMIDIAEHRMSRKNEKSVSRKNYLQKIRLPGKLADCTLNSKIGTELFLVEGDSAGGSAKQARDRQTQAVLPLRGKILNVASATDTKILSNQEIKDLDIALNCGFLDKYDENNLRYEKIIIMTDADVDGAHISSLLMTFFFLKMPKLIVNGHLYLSCPPLYRLTQNNKSHYAANDQEKKVIEEKLLKKSKSKVEISRFKGLGEMTPKQLKETTMDKSKRILQQVKITDFVQTSLIVDNLMGKKPEKRFQFIQDRAAKNSNFFDQINI